MYDYTVSLDSNAIKYFTDLRKGRINSQTPIAEVVFKFLLDNKINLDFWPYFNENLERVDVTTVSKYPNFHDNIESLVILRHFDYEIYRRCGVYRSTLSKKDQDDEIQKAIERAEREFSPIIDHTNSIFNVLYSMVLKSAMIKFSERGKSIRVKAEALLNFCNTELNVMLIPELRVLVRLMNNEKFDYFDPVSPNSKNILKNLRGMAWDLAMLRGLQQNMSPTRFGADYAVLVPYYLTFDKKFIDISRLGLIDGIIIPPDLNPQIDLVPVANDLSIAIYNSENELWSRYFSEEIKGSRMVQADSTYKDGYHRLIRDIIISLENDLLSFTHKSK